MRIKRRVAEDAERRNQINFFGALGVSAAQFFSALRANVITLDVHRSTVPAHPIFLLTSFFIDSIHSINRNEFVRCIFHEEWKGE